MNKSLKIILLSVIMLWGFLGLNLVSVHGVGLNDSASNLDTAGNRTGLFNELLGSSGAFIIVATGLWMVLGTVFLGFAIYGGVTWMTAAGNKERIENARKIIFSALIGLALLMSAYAIASFVTSSLSPSASPTTGSIQTTP